MVVVVVFGVQDVEVQLYMIEEDISVLRTVDRGWTHLVRDVFRTFWRHAGVTGMVV